MDGFDFKVLKYNGRARIGRIQTPHGGFETPVFMPVGTNANVKLMTPRNLEESGAKIILSNAFHLYLKPGLEVIKIHNGLHDFMAWNRSILTDSGGFQVFSLKIEKISDEGVWVRSPIDGSVIFINPDISMEIQKTLGSDIVMSFDQCTDPDASYEEAKSAMERTFKWAKIGRDLIKPPQALFGIVQGGVYEDLRKRSTEQIISIDFEGFAIGGLSVGEPREVTLKMSEIVVNGLPEDKPRYFMGAGSPELILELVSLGVDMFDSVFPTRIARHGVALTRKGKINLRAAKYRYDTTPIDEECSCYTCTTFTKSYIHHLLSKKEVLGQILLTIHNIHFMVDFMKRVRESIENGEFEKFKREFLESYGGGSR
jgi:queuine tRNA-ribosyltransferase